MSLAIESTATPLVLNEQGVVMMRGTRIPLENVIFQYQQGASPEKIVDSFDTLRLADVYYAIGYYLSHRGEVDQYLERRRVRVEEVRAAVEEWSPQAGIRDRLLARRSPSE